MQRDPEQWPILDYAILWEDSLDVDLEKVEVGELLMHGAWKWEYPMVV